jgi:hypothetical protein
VSKLKLVASPTFTAKVGIPVAGGDPADVVMTFRHRTKSQLDEWVKESGSRSDILTFKDMVIGWDLEDAFNDDSITLLLENYMGAALATFQVYVDELVKAKAKN